MKAYAILDGGGVKGAALVGCLKAAQERGVEFAGYGGTSAGSIVALLAAVGFGPDELRSLMVDEIDFRDFLDDGGIDLARLTTLPSNFRSKLRVGSYYLRNRSLFGRIEKDLGLYNAHKLQDWLSRQVKQKLPNLKNRDGAGITFHDLEQEKCLPLKIVVSDLRSHEPLVFSARGKEERNGPVIDAVRASIGYPFAFCPVQMNESLLVDGGLSSNLPIFLFERERHEKGIPVLAFDLIAGNDNRHENDKFEQFCSNLFTTALESADILLRRVITGIHHIQVEVPGDVSALDFSLSREARKELFNAGYMATNEYFSTNKAMKRYGIASDQVQRLQSLRTKPAMVEPVLAAFAKAFEDKTGAKRVRANIMLPTGYGSRMIAYQYGMDSDPDSDLELDIGAGCGGSAWSKKKPVAGDLLEAKRLYESWGMTMTQQSKVRKDRKAMLCFPIFDSEEPPNSPEEAEALALIGVLSVDSSTALDDTGWLASRGPLPLAEEVTKAGVIWAAIFSKILR